jgi:hypothetical protein
MQSGEGSVSSRNDDASKRARGGGGEDGTTRPAWRCRQARSLAKQSQVGRPEDGASEPSGMRRKERGREVVLFVVRTGARMGHEEGVGVCGEASLVAA